MRRVGRAILMKPVCSTRASVTWRKITHLSFINAPEGSGAQGVN